MQIQYKLLIGLVLCLMVSGCTTWTYLQGSYPEKIVWQDYNRSFDESFDRVIERMTEIGVEVTELDRPNGLIKLTAHLPSTMVTTERNKKPENPDLAVVMSKNESQAIFSYYGRIIILVRPKGTGSAVGVRLIPDTYLRPTSEPLRSGVATLGNYERYIIEILNQGQ